MSPSNSENIRTFLVAYMTRKLANEDRGGAPQLSDDCDLLLSGLIDSLGFVELISAMSEHYGQEIDLDALDAEQMTIVGPLCDYVAQQLNPGAK